MGERPRGSHTRIAHKGTPAMNLDSLLQTTLDRCVKGLPPAAAPMRLAEVGQRGWNLLKGDLPLPVAAIKRAALDHNSRWMRRFLELTDAKIAPHGKTTMAPQLFAKQLADGAWGITVASVGQMLVARAFGVDRIVLANQLVGRQEIATVAEELRRDPKFDFYCLVDSLEGVRRLLEATARAKIGRPLQVLLEGGIMGARTGCRTTEDALMVARAVKAASPHLALRGVEGFEGLLTSGPAAEQDAKVSAFLDYLAEIARLCAVEKLFAPGPIILTAGGSAFFDLAATRLHNAAPQGVEVVIRSGCYLTHDSKSYRDMVGRLMERMPAAKSLGEGLKPALEVWAYVQSRPEPGRMIATMGKRDVGFDVTLPILEQWYRPGLHSTPQPTDGLGTVVALNDQHAHIEIPKDAPFQVGDLLSFGVSHPCTTFDRWQLIYEVDEHHNVIGAIRTFF
jgi:D-serine dehydratase